MKTLKQLRADKRVASITKYTNDEQFDYETTYEINLNDGYLFDGDHGMEWASTIEELNELMNDIEEVEEDE